MRCGWLLLVFLGLSCQKAELPFTVQKSADVQVPQLYDPYKLPNILGKKNAYQEAKFDNAESIVPKVDLDLSFSGEPDSAPAGYYEIQRCPKGAKLVTPTGVDPLTEEYSNGMQGLKERDYLYVWGKAAAGACTLLGNVHVANPFVDEFNTEKIGGTDSFSFFYLVRPCLTADKSIYGGQRTCSYAFARTKTIENYVNKVAVEKQALRADLAAQRARLEFLMMQMAGVFREKAAYLDKCGTNWINEQVVKQRLAGIGKVSLTAVAFVAGAVLSGGTAAFLAASATAQLGDKLFSKVSNAKLDDNCPTDDYDDRHEVIIANVQETMGKIVGIRGSLGEFDGLTQPPANSTLPGMAEQIAPATTP